MKQLYRKILSLWFKIPQPIRFLLVGGFNTTVSLVLFAFLIYFHAPYAAALIICYVICINLSLLTMKIFVYPSEKKSWKEYLRGWFVYLGMYAANCVFLYICIAVLHCDPIYAQFFYTVISTYTVYKLHKHVTFKQNQ